MQSKINIAQEINHPLVVPHLYWNRILHPTDFSDSSSVAFAHALKMATREQGRLTIMHTEPDSENRHWGEFPHVRQTLERWGLLPPNSPKEAVVELGLDVVKISTNHSNVVESITRYLEKHPHDLIVLATHQYQGVERWTHKPIAEIVARRAGEMTLFIPEGVNGFINSANGKVNLKTILIPVDKKPHPQIAIEAAASIAQSLECSNVNFFVMHVGEEKHFPVFNPYPIRDSQWQTITSEGRVQEDILATADRLKADLIVMVTEGHHGFLDAFRGSTTEQIVRNANCPVLAVPSEEKEPKALQESPFFPQVI